MKSTSYVLRIAVMFLCVIAAFIYGIRLLFSGERRQPATADIEYVNVFAPLPDDTALSKTDASSASAAADSSKIAAVSAADGEVLGKIVNRTIPDSSANLQQSGVHIKNSTNLDINIDELLSAKLGYTVNKNEEPQVLIVHTHATECFMNEDRDYYTSADKTRTTDNNYNVTALGETVTNKLNGAGIKTLHDKTQHDYPSYNESYSRAATTIKGYLNKYPSIKIVIDIHRDSVQVESTKTKLTAQINGRQAAQIMLVMGSQSGNIKNFPNWKENLKLAVRFQKNIESMYPTLARPLSLMSRNYNESLTTGSMLLEIGTEANTFTEAQYSALLISEALIKTLGS